MSIPDGSMPLPQDPPQDSNSTKAAADYLPLPSSAPPVDDAELRRIVKARQFQTVYPSGLRSKANIDQKGLDEIRTRKNICILSLKVLLANKLPGANAYAIYADRPFFEPTEDDYKTAYDRWDGLHIVMIEILQDEANDIVAMTEANWRAERNRREAMN